MKWQLLFLLVVVFDLQAQEPYMGAASAAMANASAGSSDAMSVFNNPGSLGFVNRDELASGYRSFFQLEGWQTVYASANKSWKNGAAGIGFNTFGDELYKTTSAVVGVGHRLGIASLGVSVHYERMQITGFGQAVSFPVDIGGKVEFSSAFYLASGVKNINQAKRTANTEERYPSSYFLGFLYEPTESLRMSWQVDYSILSPAILRAGLDYSISMLHLRVGLRTQPIQWSAGVGLDWGRLALDYAYQLHTHLGGNHFFTLTYLYLE